MCVLNQRTNEALRNENLVMKERFERMLGVMRNAAEAEDHEGLDHDVRLCLASCVCVCLCVFLSLLHLLFLYCFVVFCL